MAVEQHQCRKAGCQGKAVELAKENFAQNPAEHKTKVYLKQT
jgi:hypothetical protein